MTYFLPKIGIGDTTGILPSMQAWSYDMYPAMTPRSIAYPSDAISVLNDKKLYSFDLETDSMVRQSAMLESTLLPIAKLWQAQNTQQYMNILGNMSANTNSNLNNLNGNLNWNIPGLEINNSSNVNNNRNVNNNGNNNKKALKDEDVYKYMARTGALDTYGEELRKKVKLADGTETTYVQRLVELAKDYVTSEDDTELTPSEFAQLKEIATKMRDDVGSFSKQDFLTLKNIVKAHLGEIDKKKDKTKNNDDVDKTETSALPDRYAQEYIKQQSGAPDSYGVISGEFENALYHSDANEKDLSKITKKVNEYNVLNIANDFKENYGTTEEENIIDAIFADTTKWGKGKWYDLNTYCADDAKPSVQKICKELTERANEVIKNNPKMDAETKKDLKAKISALNGSIQKPEIATWGGIKGFMCGSLFGFLTPTLTNDAKTKISSSFQDLVDTLTQVENDIYGKIEMQ